MSSPTRILLLEIDAAEKGLLLSWAEAGMLPTLKSLLAKGLIGHTTTPPGLYVGATWPSFFTGVNPARHGIHSLAQLKPGTYEIARYAAEQVKREPFWNVLSRAGKKVAVLDVPLSGVSTGLNGIQTVEWGSHDAVAGFRTWPPSLAREVESRFGQHPVADCNADRKSPQEFLALRDALVLGVEKKAELTKRYLNRGGWDFFLQVFTEGHCIGHQCWHLHDASHPGHEPDFARITGDPIQDVYVAIDRAVGDLLALAGEDATIIVLAGHGMGSKRGAQFLLHEILVRLGVAVPVRPAADKPPDVLDRFDSLLTWGWRHTPATVKRTLGPLRNRLRWWMDEPKGLPAPKLDAARGKCFLVENHFAVGGIRLNLRGREPQGLVQPGPESEVLCTQLARDLLEIRDVTTGKQVVRRVMRTRDLYRGEYLDHLPDLLVEWSTEVPLGTGVVGKPGSGTARLTSPRIGLVEGENRYCRTGEHLPEGLFVATGAGIEPGVLRRTVSIMDFAPSVAKLLGVDLPDVDGEPIAELLKGLS